MERDRGRHWRRALVTLATGAAVLSFATPAGAFVTPAGAVITVTPSTGLLNGQTVNVEVSGVPPNETGAIIECNSDPNQPTVDFLGIPAPVSCSAFLAGRFPSGAITTSASGTVDEHYVVQTGVLGPVVGGPDSTGAQANVDAAKYPCPPTPAERAAGDVCWIGFADLRSNLVHQDISFAPPLTQTPFVMLDDRTVPDGSQIGVRGFGFTPDSPLSIEECNLTPGEPSDPTGLRPVVGCTAPQGGNSFQPRPGSYDDDVNSAFVVMEGNIGGNPVSANYPCPPSPADVAAGGSCAIYVQDGGGLAGAAALEIVGPAPSPNGTRSDP